MIVKENVTMQKNRRYNLIFVFSFIFSQDTVKLRTPILNFHEDPSTIFPHLGQWTWLRTLWNQTEVVGDRNVFSGFDYLLVLLRSLYPILPIELHVFSWYRKTCLAQDRPRLCRLTFNNSSFSSVQHLKATIKSLELWFLLRSSLFARLIHGHMVSSTTFQVSPNDLVLTSNELSYPP